MSEQQLHKFRYLLPPGNNFQFVAKFKIWIIISLILMSASIASLFVNKQVRGDYMNWTIDFKGGTEIILAFKDRATNQYVKVEPGKVRTTLEKKEKHVEVTDITWKTVDTKTDNEVTVNGIVIRTTRFAAIQPQEKEKARALILEKLNKPAPTDASPAPVDASQDAIQKVTWSGDRLNIRSTVHVSNKEMYDLLAPLGLQVRPWLPEEQALYAEADKGTREYSQWYTIAGIDKQYEESLETELGVDVEVHQSYGVGAKAGAKLRDDGIKSIIYAIFLIMLYLAFRFDIRYAPGAAFATIHDAVMVIGVFAVTWTEVSLVSVAGLLTVVGFSVNDTVVVFDRIRENQAKLKDKKIERIIDISINEVLVRSILTSATVFATTLIMNIFGAGLVQNFAFAMNVGVIVGAYSSIFLAAPFFLFITRKWYSGNTAPRRRVAAAPAAPAKKEAKDDEDAEA